MKKARPDQSKAVPVSEVDSEQRDEILRLYKLQMPEDLYHLWDFCRQLCPDDPRGMFSLLTVCVVTEMSLQKPDS